MATEPSFTELPVTRCAACARDVLCYVERVAEGGERMRCVECGGEAAAEALRWLDLHDLEELGYGYVIPEGGCGRPDCGRGRCGRSAELG